VEGIVRIKRDDPRRLAGKRERGSSEHPGRGDARILTEIIPVADRDDFQISRINGHLVTDAGDILC